MACKLTDVGFDATQSNDMKVDALQHPDLSTDTRVERVMQLMTHCMFLGTSVQSCRLA